MIRLLTPAPIKKVAAVDSKGKITAKGKGTAIITVKSGKVSVKCKITVK